MVISVVLTISSHSIAHSCIKPFKLGLHLPSLINFHPNFILQCLHRKLRYEYYQLEIQTHVINLLVMFLFQTQGFWVLFRKKKSRQLLKLQEFTCIRMAFMNNHANDSKDNTTGNLTGLASVHNVTGIQVCTNCWPLCIKVVFENKSKKSESHI